MTYVTVAAEQMTYLSREIARLNHVTATSDRIINELAHENEQLRAELAERTQATSPIRLLNNLRAGLNQIGATLEETR